jgi:hypothetical protein
MSFINGAVENGYGKLELAPSVAWIFQMLWNMPTVALPSRTIGHLNVAVLPLDWD